MDHAEKRSPLSEAWLPPTALAEDDLTEQQFQSTSSPRKSRTEPGVLDGLH